MKKEVIRVGDRVRIVNPEIVIRVGYPLTIKSQMAILEKDPNVKKAIVDLFSVATLDKSRSTFFRESQSKDPELQSFLSASQMHELEESREYRDILYQLARYRLAELSYGGNTKKIYIEKKEHLIGKLYLVVRKRVVRTGTYVPGTSSFRSYCGDYADCGPEPAYLANGETHILLTLRKCRFSDPFDLSSGFEIERKNVRKFTTFSKFAFESHVL